MKLTKLLAFSLLNGAALTVQGLADISPKITQTVTLTVPVTETVYNTVSPSSSSSSTSAGPTETPAPLYTMRAVRSGASVIDFLPINAAGLNFYVGGSPATYCPTVVDQCPVGNVTAVIGSGSLDVEVPGGQIIFVAPDGHLGFTQAHSASYPVGAVLGPLVYTKPGNQSIAYVTTYAFNAPGFLACPSSLGNYQVFAAIANATVPGGNISQCLGFDIIAYPFQGVAAWQYI